MSDRTAPVDPVPLRLESTVLYGDFNCPFSALAHDRAQRLNEGSATPLDWRAVEHDAAIPERGSVVDQSGQAQFEAELEQIRSQLTDADPHDFKVPSRRINTARLNVLLASLPTSQRSGFARSVFAAYWRDGVDLNDPDEIAAIGVTATPEGEALARQWQSEWEGFERRIIPMLRLPDGTLSRGLGALARLR